MTLIVVFYDHVTCFFVAHVNLIGIFSCGHVSETVDFAILTSTDVFRETLNDVRATLTSDLETLTSDLETLTSDLVTLTADRVTLIFYDFGHVTSIFFATALLIGTFDFYHVIDFARVRHADFRAILTAYAHVT